MPTQFLEKVAHLRPWILIMGSLFVFVLLSLRELKDESPTYDESAHLAAGLAPLVLDDYRLLPEQPPLARRLAAFPLLFDPPVLPVHHPSWNRVDYFTFGFVFLYQSGNDSDAILFRARLAMLLWGCLLIVSVYAVARERFGPAGGLISLTAATFCPLLLGHAHLVTTDVPAAAMIFLSVIAFERWLKRPGFGTALSCGLLSGGAFATKLSAVLLLPIYLILGARTLWLAGRSAESGPVWKRLRNRQSLLRMGELAGMALVAWLTIWAVYGFRFKASPAPGFHLADHLLFSTPQAGQLRSLHSLELLPEAFLCGLSELRAHTLAGHPAFALGLHSDFGWPWYFPLVFLLKSPVSFLILLAFGLLRWRRLPPAERAQGEDVLVSACIVLFVNMAGTLNMGLRYLLPAFPFLFLGLGACGIESVTLPSEPRMRRAVPWVLLGLVLECGIAGPFYLSYFNGVSLALANRHDLVVDSNLDWGQDLRRLKKYMETHDIAKVKLAYHGWASPRQLKLDHEWLNAEPLYAPLEPEWKRADSLLPGDYLAVSASYLSVMPERRILEAIQGQPRVATVGHSIYVYRIQTPRRR